MLWLEDGAVSLSDLYMMWSHLDVAGGGSWGRAGPRVHVTDLLPGDSWGVRGEQLGHGCCDARVGDLGGETSC